MKMPRVDGLSRACTDARCGGENGGQGDDRNVIVEFNSAQAAGIV